LTTNVIIISPLSEPPLPIPEPPPVPLKKQDLNLLQLKQYDGTGEDGRVCVAVNGKVYDVTRGKRFYGPGKDLYII
jgi:membrane-associated progesterone receptor component